MFQFDKLLHLSVGAGIYLIFWLFAHPLVCLIPVLGIAIAKEIYDLHKHGKPDIWDAVATALGGLITYFITLNQ